MPKPNPTMLDRLVKTFKSTGNTAPFREMGIRGEFNDPLNYTIRQRISMQGAPELAYMAVPQPGVGHGIKMTPERVRYQRGIDARIAPRLKEVRRKMADAYDLKDEYENEWLEAVEEAKSDMAEDWSSALDDQDFSEVNHYILEDVRMPSNSLRDYWPSGARSPEEIEYDFDDAQDEYFAARDAESELLTPKYRMREQMMTPRYRNYQRAMRQRQENAQMGRLNAAIMNLYRRGYSMPEIREILRNQRIQ